MNIILVEGFHDAAFVSAICDQASLNGNLRIERMGGLPRADKRDTRLNAMLQAWIAAREVRSVGLIVDADNDPSRIWRRLQRLPILLNTDPPISDESLSKTGFVSNCHIGARVVNIGVWVMPDNQDPGQLEDFVLRMVPDRDLVKTPARRYIEALPNEIVEVDDYRIAKHVAHAWLSAYYPGWSFDDALKNGRLAEPSHDVVGAAFLSWLQRLTN